MVDPRAAFDYLSILIRIGDTFGAMSEAEVHLFSYLACLLSLYRGAPAADWGYQFARTHSGSPFSKAISDAGDLVRDGALIVESSGLRAITSRGCEVQSNLRRLADNQGRLRYIEAACSSVLAMPFGEVRAAIMQEPNLRRSDVTDRIETLLVGTAIFQLHEQFQALSLAVGPDVEDLLVPSVVWLTYLSRMRAVEAGYVTVEHGVKRK